MKPHYGFSCEETMENCTVHLFVFEGMADWEAAFALASIQNPQPQMNLGQFSVTTAARYHAPITTFGGVRILPHMTIDEVFPSESSLLILPGGPAWEACGNFEALERAHAFVEEGVPVAAIGAATLALARTGLLDARRHTSNDSTYLANSGYRGARHYRDVPAISDRKVITASGNAPLEFAHEVSRQLRLASSSALATWTALHKHGSPSRFCAAPARCA
jgi:putative intracellular protease/amidase